MLELLVGVTVLSLIVVTLYSGFRLGARSWEAGQSGADSSSELRVASAFLRRQLGKSIPLAVNKGAEWKIWFYGSPDRVLFVTHMPAYAGRGGLFEMTLAVEGVDDHRLMVDRTPLRDHRSTDAGKESGRPKALIDHLVDARFAYFGTLGEEEVPSWHDRWEDATRLPLLVRMRLATREAGEWPELVIPVNANGVRYWQGPDDERSPGTRGRQMPRRRASL